MALRIHVEMQARVAGDTPIGKRDALSVVRRGARAALEAHALTDAELAITLLDDPAIADLNARYLGHEGPTDVISFALGEEAHPPIGDIYIGWCQALRQAAEFDVPIAEELARLAIHGTLHVLGYDHPAGEERERSEMWKRQESIVREVMAK